MAHRADGLSDIFEHNVIVREQLTADKIKCDDIQLNSPTQNVTSTRAIDTIYKNNSNYTIFVNVSLLFSITISFKGLIIFSLFISSKLFFLIKSHIIFI